MGFQKTEAVKEVWLFSGVNDRTVRSWRREFCAVVSLVRTIEESMQDTRDYFSLVNQTAFFLIYSKSGDPAERKGLRSYTRPFFSRPNILEKKRSGSRD